MQDRKVINRLLQSAGFGRLEEGAGLCAQMGYLVSDHDHLRSLLVACEPEQRTAMYESLRAYLRFEPKPLDVYLADAARIAEERQYPLQGPDGTLRAFNAPDVRTAQEAVGRAFAKETLTVVCVKCTKTAEFPGDRKADAVYACRLAGWGYDQFNGVGREICPECLEAS